MKTKPANKKNIVTLSIAGALLVGGAALLGTVYGPSLKAGVSTFPNNPFPSRPTSTPTPTPPRRCAVNPEELRESLSELTLINLKITQLQTQISLLITRSMDPSISAAEKDYLLATIDALIARLNSLYERQVELGGGINVPCRPEGPYAPA